MSELRTALQDLLDAEQQFEEMLGRPLMQYSHEARAVRDRLDAAVAAARETLAERCMLEKRVADIEVALGENPAERLCRLEERISDLEQRIPNP